MSKINIKGTTVIDLSHTIEPGVPLPVGFPGPRFDFFLSQVKGDVVNAEVLTMVIHMATHVDAPFHFYSNLRPIDEVPADCLIGAAVVVDMTSKKGSVPIEADDFKNWEKATGETIKPEDALLLRTGHSQYWNLGEAGTQYRMRGWPYLTRSSVDYLLSKQIRLIGVETMDPDLIDPNDFSTSEFPAHRAFLSHGILIIENLVNLDKIPGTRCQLIAVPLKLKGCTGSPVRVLAVV